MPDDATSYVGEILQIIKWKEPQILGRFLFLWASRIVLKTAIISNELLKK